MEIYEIKRGLYSEAVKKLLRSIKCKNTIGKTIILITQLSINS